MAPSLLQPQGHLSSPEALKLAQEAPAILRKNPKAVSASPLVSLFLAPESPELWTIYENLLLTCLRTGDDESANQCLQRLVQRFGEKNERVMALAGLIKEAQADSDSKLKEVLTEYEDILKEDSANIPITKRRIALLRSMGKTADAVTALQSLLEFSPTDAEAWSELADLYLSQGLYSQALYALEEVVILSPNAWNIHAWLGEVSLMAAKTAAEGGLHKQLADALKRFCRSVELCEDYLRGYYGLKTTTDRILSDWDKVKKHNDSDSFSLPSKEVVEKLNETATKKLTEIVRRHGEGSWKGYDAAEVAAARALLDKSSASVVR